MGARRKRKRDHSGKEGELAEELADIMIHCLNFADRANIDPLEAIYGKIRLNAAKYPVDSASDSPDYGTYFAPGNDQEPSGARAAPLQTRLIVWRERRCGWLVASGPWRVSLSMGLTSISVE